MPGDEFVRGVRKLCTRYGTLFIADEVATGFGRTGKLFACEHFDLEPDVLCMAKAITGGYGGLGAVITTSKIAKAIKEEDVLMLFPALTITRETAQRGLDIFEASL